MGVGCHLAHDFDGGGELGAAACRCISAPATLGRLQETAGLGRAVAIATAAGDLGNDGATAGRRGHFDAKMAHPLPSR